MGGIEADGGAPLVDGRGVALRVLPMWVWVCNGGDGAVGIRYSPRSRFPACEHCDGPVTKYVPEAPAGPEEA